MVALETRKIIEEFGNEKHGSPLIFPAVGKQVWHKKRKSGAQHPIFKKQNRKLS